MKRLKLALHRRITVYYHLSTPYPEYLLSTIRANEKARKELMELRSMLTKFFALGYTMETEVKKRRENEIEVVIEKVIGKPVPKMYVYVPTDEMINRFAEASVFNILSEIERIAREEKEKAEKELQKLIDAGLVVEEEEDC